MTKREIRAATLAALAPMPRQHLWDIGAGCGTVAIEWMRTHPSCRATAVERLTSRIRLIAQNALSLGVPGLEMVEGEAADVLSRLDALIQYLSGVAHRTPVFTKAAGALCRLAVG